MNTLRDTNERQARPSVWPVYVAGAIIGLFSLSFTGWVWFLPMMAQQPADVWQQLHPASEDFHNLIQQFVPYALLFSLYGLFGIATAVGAVLLRSRAWWCAVAWVTLYAAWYVYVIANVGVSGLSPTKALITVAFYALIIWPLATRRRLFFPPKPEGEE